MTNSGWLTAEEFFSQLREDIHHKGDRMSKQILFEFVAIYHPKPTKSQRDEGRTATSEILTDPPIQTVLANDDKAAGILAARSIPDEYLDRLDQIEIVVRPFV